MRDVERLARFTLAQHQGASGVDEWSLITSLVRGALTDTGTDAFRRARNLSAADQVTADDALAGLRLLPPTVGTWRRWNAC